MGISSVAFVSAGFLVESLKKEDLRAKKKGWVVDRCDELLLKATAPGWLGAKNRRSMLESGGLCLAQDVLTIWESNEVIVLTLFKLLLSLLKTEGVAEDIIRRGGDDVIKRAHDGLCNDKEARTVGQLLIDGIVGRGSKVGREWLKKLKKALDCGVPLHAAEDVFDALMEPEKSAKIVPTSDEYRVRGTSGLDGSAMDKLVSYMNKYPESESLQLEAIDVIIQLAKEKSSSAEVVKHKGLVALIAAMSEHPSSTKVQWRGCMAIAELGSELLACIELAKCGACEVLMSFFHLSVHEDAKDGPHANSDNRQQALFAISSLCRENTYCVPKFESLDIKILLCDLLLRDDDARDVIVPLRLRRLYTFEDLESAKRFWRAPEVAPIPKEHKVRGVPKPPIIPLHGTVDDCFADPGDPGLI